MHAGAAAELSGQYYILTAAAASLGSHVRPVHAVSLSCASAHRYSTLLMPPMYSALPVCMMMLCGMGRQGYVTGDLLFVSRSHLADLNLRAHTTKP